MSTCLLETLITIWIFASFQLKVSKSTRKHPIQNLLSINSLCSHRLCSCPSQLSRTCYVRIILCHFTWVVKGLLKIMYVEHFKYKWR